VLRRKVEAPSAAFTLRAGKGIAIAAVVLCGWLLSNSTAREARDTLIAVAVGLAIHWAGSRQRGKPALD
jgi:predicted anti-sigma-YlaC factor YlaD